MTARSGSEQRQRTEQVGVRLTPDEMAALTALADAAAVTPSEYLRAALPADGQAVAVGLSEDEQRWLDSVAEQAARWSDAACFTGRTVQRAIDLAARRGQDTERALDEVERRAAEEWPGPAAPHLDVVAQHYIERLRDTIREVRAAGGTP